MARLIAPNGVAVDASEADERVFLAAGYVREEQPKPKAAPRKRTAKPNPKQQED